MYESIVIRPLAGPDEAKLLDRESARHYPWHQLGEKYRNCYQENQAGTRVTLLAYYEGEMAGCCHLLYYSGYPYFASANIPEISDLTVFPPFRRLGIASRLFGQLEATAALTSDYVGLGVGLYKDYGNAQMMYGKRGYTPDGRGMVYKNQPVIPGQPVMVDDDLLLYLLKRVGSEDENNH